MKSSPAALDLESSVHVLSLRDVAGWDPLTHMTGEPPIRASVPALQRGLVWQPQQIEMLWDSILRGFPIGALVVCPKLDEQERGTDARVTHHLLDGQQRCNAIALGFTDPFLVPSPETDEKAAASILWLDLNPTLDGKSTRNFLTRLTTLAHPWGYRQDDNANRISTSSMRDALVKMEHPLPSVQDYVRPPPARLWPHVAQVPVPMAWLFQAPQQDECAFWAAIALRVEGSTVRWADPVRAFLGDTSPEAIRQRSHIYRGISRATSAPIIALNAPVEILEASQQEMAVREEREDISSIEHLFQRLNRQGTRLDGEELAYSMIKAYWPEIANHIDQIAKKRMPQARLVSLAVRAALAEGNAERLPGVVGVSALRAMVKTRSEKRSQIRDFIQNRLESACDQVDTWLRYDSGSRPEGLLKIHITSIAHGSPDLYLLLLCFAERLRITGDSSGAAARLMPGLATLVHWFAVDKGKIVNRIHRSCENGITLRNIRGALKEGMLAGELLPIHSPAEVDAFVGAPGAELEEWNWWTPVHGDGSEEGMASRQKSWEGFLGFRGNRELLLYAQRDFLARRFPDYDPARRDLWEEHNRPWDFDHILAYKYFYNRKDGTPFRGVCHQWGNTIGNLRAWPFEDNRSDQAETARDKIHGDDVLLSHSFLLPQEEAGFSGGDDVRRDQANARTFIHVCRSRLLRIYETWYETVGIAELIVADEEVSETTECPVDSSEPASIVTSIASN